MKLRKKAELVNGRGTGRFSRITLYEGVTGEAVSYLKQGRDG